VTKPVAGQKNTTTRKKTTKKIGKMKVLSSEPVFQGRIFGVERDEIIEPSGIRVVREWIAHPGSVVVMPVFPDERIVLIQQYRYAVQEDLWELVAGHKEKGETPMEGARRELREETGYTARKFTKLLEIYPSPGMLSERMDIFLAEGLTEGEAQPEEDEIISKKVMPLDEALRWIESGKIRDAKSVSGILFYASFVAKHKVEQK
jgi:ADP-ribose pyrophosphatase